MCAIYPFQKNKLHITLFVISIERDWIWYTFTSGLIKKTLHNVIVKSKRKREKDTKVKI